MATDFKLSFHWTDRTMMEALPGAVNAAHQYLTRATKFHSTRTEREARLEAPWTDRTGNARQGLTSVPVLDRSGQGHFEIQLFHSMWYGYFLETKNPTGRGVGKYAIIMPTIDLESKEYFKTASDIFKGIFGKAGYFTNG